MADRVVFVFTLILAGVYFYATAQIPTLEIGDPLGPKAFPRLLGIGLLITAGMMALEMWRARQSKPAAQAPVDGNRMHYVVVAAVVGWTFLYFVVFEKLGYMIATAIYLTALTLYFNKRKPVMNIVTSLLFAVISYFLFTKLLGVTLARGFLPF